MKVPSLLFLLILLSTFLSITTVSAQENPVEHWALIICGSQGPQDQHTFSNDAQYMYHVLNEHHCYDFDGIYYLDVYTDRNGVNALSTKANVRAAITDWLGDNADENDMAFIYFSSHGAGYNTINNINEGGRIDGSEGDVVDEGLEHFINGNWVGYDERMQVQDGWYWDDELADDLNNVSGRIVLVRQGCVEENMSCFGGGLIDDLSGPNRIIMTASNETYYSYGDREFYPGNPGYGCSEWSERFIDALHGERVWVNYVTDEVVHTGEIVNADFDGNRYVSLWEAWIHAWDTDEARYAVGHLPGIDETPWFDDDGDGLPTFINGSDHLDEDGQGDLAKQTYLEKVPVCTMKTNIDGYFYIPTVATDIMEIEKLFYAELVGDQTGPSSLPDRYVGIDDIVFIAGKFGSSEDDPDWNYMADLVADRYVGIDDIVTAAEHFGGNGTYITNLSEVTATFNTSQTISPDSNGFVTIPQGAINFTVKRNGTSIGAMIIFW
jgi:hypothetical protein